TVSPLALKRVGLAPTLASLPASVALGSLAALLVPGALSAGIARGAEVVFRNSLFRSGYEPLYNAIPRGHRRASKTVVDVGFERVGDALGALLAWALVPLGVHLASQTQLVSAVALAVSGLFLGRLIH